MGQSSSDLSAFEQLYLHDLPGVCQGSLLLENANYGGSWDIPLLNKVQRILYRLWERFSGPEIHLTHTATWEGYSLYD